MTWRRPVILRIEAILLTVVVFLGFNVAWLLLFGDTGHSRGRSLPPVMIG
jgi:hypothetical protein